VREDLPCIPYGDEFKKVALSLKRDEISSPVRTAMGFELIQADSVTSGGVLSFDEGKNEARQLLRSELTDGEFRKRGELLKNQLGAKTYSTLDSFAQAVGLPVAETAQVDLEAGYLPKIGSIREDLDLIKDLRDGEFYAGVLRTSDACFVLELVKKEPAHIPPFEKVADAVREDSVTSEAAHLAHVDARAITSQAKTLDELKKLATVKGFQLKQTEPFTRDNADRILPNLDPNFRRLTLGYKVGTIHLTTQGNPQSPIAYIVWFYEKREEASREQFRKDLPTLRAEYLMELQQALFEEWLHDQRQKIPAKINPAFLKQEEMEEKAEQATE